MLSNIAGYDWPVEGTKQVVYTTWDDHVHEMVTSGDKGDRRWRDVDITRDASAPLVPLETAILTAYAWPEGHTRQIDYVSPGESDGHVRELVMMEGKAWNYEDIMQQVPQAALADGSAIVGYSWRATGIKQVIYTGRDNHLHELSAGKIGMWRSVDLTNATGAPEPEGSALAGFAWEGGATKQVAYVTGDGHIHGLHAGQDGMWKHSDVTDATNAPVADGSVLSGYALEDSQTGGSKQYVYKGTDQHIYELSMGKAGAWRYEDLTERTEAQLAEGSALAAFPYETLREKYVAFVDLYGHIHEMVGDINGNWTRSNVTNLTNAPKADSGLLIGFTWNAQLARQILFLDTNENPHIHELMIEQGKSWQHTDLTNLTGARNMV